MVDPGNLIKADDTMMTTIVSQDPLYVYFDVHEQAMLRIRRLIQEGKVKARSEKEVSVQIGLSDEKDSEEPVYPHQGIVDFTDNRVDLNTGTLRFRAKIDNPNQMISPGLFVKVRLPIGEAHPALMVREQALQSDQGRKKVFVLQPKDEEGNPYFIKDARTSWSRMRRASRSRVTSRSRSMSASRACCGTGSARSARESSPATWWSPRACRRFAWERTRGAKTPGQGPAVRSREGLVDSPGCTASRRFRRRFARCHSRGHRKIAHRGPRGSARGPGRRQPRRHAKTVLPETRASARPLVNTRRQRFRIHSRRGR